MTQDKRVGFVRVFFPKSGNGTNVNKLNEKSYVPKHKPEYKRRSTGTNLFVRCWCERKRFFVDASLVRDGSAPECSPTCYNNFMKRGRNVG